MDKFTAWLIKQSGRSWWQARYASGKILSEWDTCSVFANAATSRWEQVEKKGMVGLRLLCPNGMAGELEAPEGSRFLQLKQGCSDIGGGTGRHIGAHIIGVVKNVEGDCNCYAWDYERGELIHFMDNVFHMAYRNIGCLSLEVQGIKL